MFILATGLFAQLTYITPVMADDFTSDSNDNEMFNIASNEGTTIDQGSNDDEKENSSQTDNDKSNDDAGAPDTATGDDDY